ncbi:MAG: hypothetical protein ABIJ09_17930 [Pseudomonadota bacterium]
MCAQRTQVVQALGARLSDDAGFTLWAVPALLDPGIVAAPWPGLPPPEQTLDAALVLDPAIRSRAGSRSPRTPFRALWLMPAASKGGRLSLAVLVEPDTLRSGEPWVLREQLVSTLARQGVRLRLRFVTAEPGERWPGSVQFAVPLCGAFPEGWLSADERVTSAGSTRDDGLLQDRAPAWVPQLPTLAPAMSLRRVLRRALFGLAVLRGQLLDVPARRDLLQDSALPELWCEPEAIALTGLWGVLHRDAVLAESAGAALALVHEDAHWIGMRHLLGLPPCHDLPPDPRHAVARVHEVLVEFALLLDALPGGGVLAGELRQWVGQFDESAGWIPRSLVRELYLPARPHRLVLQLSTDASCELRAEKPDGALLSQGVSPELALGQLASDGLLLPETSLRVLPPLQPRRCSRLPAIFRRWFASPRRALVLIETAEPENQWSLESAPRHRVVLLVRRGTGVLVQTLENQQELSWLALVPRAAVASTLVVPVAGARAWILARFAASALAALACGQDLLVDTGSRPLAMTQRSWQLRPAARGLSSLLGRRDGLRRVAAIGTGVLVSTLRRVHGSAPPGLQAAGLPGEIASPAAVGMGQSLHVVEDPPCVACLDATGAVSLWPCESHELGNLVEDLSHFCRASGFPVRVMWHADGTEVVLHPPRPAGVDIELVYQRKYPRYARVGDLHIELDRRGTERLAQAILACTSPYRAPRFCLRRIEMPGSSLTYLLRLRQAIHRRLQGRLSRLAERTQITPQAWPAASR